MTSQQGGWDLCERPEIVGQPDDIIVGWAPLIQSYRCMDVQALHFAPVPDFSHQLPALSLPALTSALASLYDGDALALGSAPDGDAPAPAAASTTGLAKRLVLDQGGGSGGSTPESGAVQVAAAVRLSGAVNLASVPSYSNPASAPAPAPAAASGSPPGQGRRALLQQQAQAPGTSSSSGSSSSTSIVAGAPASSVVVDCAGAQVGLAVTRGGASLEDLVLLNCARAAVVVNVTDESASAPVLLSRLTIGQAPQGGSLRGVGGSSSAGGVGSQWGVFVAAGTVVIDRCVIQGHLHGAVYVGPGGRLQLLSNSVLRWNGAALLEPPAPPPPPPRPPSPSNSSTGSGSMGGARGASSQGGPGSSAVHVSPGGALLRVEGCLFADNLARKVRGLLLGWDVLCGHGPVHAALWPVPCRQAVLIVLMHGTNVLLAGFPGLQGGALHITSPRQAEELEVLGCEFVRNRWAGL